MTSTSKVFQPGMTVTYVGTRLAESDPDIYLATGTVGAESNVAQTLVYFGANGVIAVPHEDLILAGGQRVTFGERLLNGVTSDTQDLDRTSTHRTIVIWDNGDVTAIQTSDLLASDAPRNDAGTTITSALDKKPDTEAAPGTIAELRTANEALKAALRAALDQGWHGEDCETEHMVRNPKCNCWRADAIQLIPDGATYAD
ncbi:hypothetical protein [Curtobacterium sp. MCBD17_040]|uniref:hypothetical protein n=1 Tax=Curtobacterium sp. MCBD17_040 TaxID=2175674 RepID=UPI000DAA8928|nr:hypothetical protein [Curtobacterium sp. MCBD17_040]WIB65281.1 hypothetical protein DEI94_17910 [Curtobacterium sp. MCBD17_040]